jgi:hypothetical protein
MLERQATMSVNGNEHLANWHLKSNILWLDYRSEFERMLLHYPSLGQSSMHSVIIMKIA